MAEMASYDYNGQNSYFAEAMSGMPSLDNTNHGAEDDEFVDAPEHKESYKYKQHYDTEDEVQEIINVNKNTGSEQHNLAYLQAIGKLPASNMGHMNGCSGARGASTPPDSPPGSHALPSTSNVDKKPETKEEANAWVGPDELRDISKAFLRERRWHIRVAPLRPQVALAPHRYWIGVLNPDTQAKNASKPDHFIWMKGNRLTTVETVRKTYAASTMCEDVFMVGGERPGDEVRMEELDLFNDKVVLFRIVKDGTPESVGRLITEGLVTKEIEVIDLDDD